MRQPGIILFYMSHYVILYNEQPIRRSLGKIILTWCDEDGEVDINDQTGNPRTTILDEQEWKKDFPKCTIIGYLD